VAGGYGGSHWSALFDLPAGRWLARESQLLPHYEPALANLLARHLLHERNYWRRRYDGT
jgi:hypothetical protein